MAEECQPQLHRRHDAEEEREDHARFVTRADMTITDAENKGSKTRHDERESADEVTVTDPVPAHEPNVEARDGGLFGSFMGKKEEEDKRKPEEEEVSAVSEDFEKVNVSEPEKKMEGEEKQLQRSNSGSSSISSSDEDEAEGGEKKRKKGLKEKIKEMVSGGGDQREEEESEIKMPDKEEQVAAPAGPANQAEDNKSFMARIKEKLPVPAIATTRNSEVPPAPPPTKEEAHAQEGESVEKKGIFEKIKEKIPGYQAKTLEGNAEKDKQGAVY